MWRVLIKVLVLKFAGRFASAKLHNVTKSFASFAESRANLLASNIALEWDRVFKSFVAILIMAGTIAFSSLIGIVWIFAIAWNSPHRELFLGFSMTLPLIIAAYLYVYLRRLWHEKAFLDVSRDVLNKDWETLQHGLQMSTNEQAN